jgi:hypothetical protein
MPLFEMISLYNPKKIQNKSSFKTQGSRQHTILESCLVKMIVFS